MFLLLLMAMITMKTTMMTTKMLMIMMMMAMMAMMTRESRPVKKTADMPRPSTSNPEAGNPKPDNSNVVDAQPLKTGRMDHKTRNHPMNYPRTNNTNSTKKKKNLHHMDLNDPKI